MMGRAIVAVLGGWLVAVVCRNGSLGYVEGVAGVYAIWYGVDSVRRWRGANARWWWPWRLLTMLNRLHVWCWASLVHGKCFGNAPMFRRNTACVRVLADHEGHARLTCYCGFWDDPARSQCPSRQGGDSCSVAGLLGDEV